MRKSRIGFFWVTWTWNGGAERKRQAWCRRRTSESLAPRFQRRVESCLEGLESWLELESNLIRFDSVLQLSLFVVTVVTGLSLSLSLSLAPHKFSSTFSRFVFFTLSPPFFPLSALHLPSIKVHQSMLLRLIPDSV